MCLKWFLINLLPICLVAYMGANRRENLTLDQDSLSPQFQTSFCFSLQFLLPHCWRSEKSVTDNGFLFTLQSSLPNYHEEKNMYQSYWKDTNIKEVNEDTKISAKGITEKQYQLQHRDYSYFLLFQMQSNTSRGVTSFSISWTLG